MRGANEWSCQAILNELLALLQKTYRKNVRRFWCFVEAIEHYPACEKLPYLSTLSDYPMEPIIISHQERLKGIVSY